ncbi:DUF5004 domain-containing protein [Geojedonia litorea]|uniref:DUF5004 domain-containing protein n=1 Tax=Geojedonia litorea TaxID=1268269 RepID=A0ABV9N5B8_9FLAO
MKKLLIQTSCILVLTLLLTGCDIGDDVQCPSPLTGALTSTETDLVGEWVLSAIVAEDAVDLTNDQVSNPSTDIYSQYSACQRDLVYTFGNDRKYKVEQGLTATNCQNKQTLQGTWRLSNINLNLVVGCSTQNTEIEFGENKTTFSQEATVRFNNVDGFTITTLVVFTYTKSE